jgi:hypothetical protein
VERRHRSPGESWMLGWARRAMSEYTRFFEGSDRDFSRAQMPAERLHLDVVLLLPILAIMTLGLFVLFSASDGDWDTVNRQIRNFVVGFAVFVSRGPNSPRHPAAVGPHAVSCRPASAAPCPLLWGGCKGRAAMAQLGFYPLSAVRDHEDCHAVNGGSVGCAARPAAAA